MKAAMQLPIQRETSRDLVGTTVYLIRHGQVADRKDLTAEERADIPLGEIGREQARKLACRMRDVRLTGIYASDLTRAIETARIVAADRGLDVAVRSELRDIEVGQWRGIKTQKGKERYADFLLGRLVEEDGQPIPLGESFIQLRARVMPCYERIVAENIDKCIAIVAHAAVIKVIVCSVLGLALQNRKRIEVNNAGLTRIDYLDGQGVIIFYNDIAHLE